MSDKVYVQYGAGTQAIDGWLNFDASPTLLIQRMPLLGRVLRSRLNCLFDDEIRYGDIVRGLPLTPGSVEGIFCSHVLEHLTYADFSTALKNSFSYLKSGGMFRVVVPDLQYYIDQYQRSKSSGDVRLMNDAAFQFCKSTCLGVEGSRKNISHRIIDVFRGSAHRWMWDYQSLSQALSEHGFVAIRRFSPGECEDEMFLRPERDHMFGPRESPYGLALECCKP